MDDNLKDAIELIGMAMPARSYPGTGGLWFGHNQNMADATFEDWGLARAVAIILNAVHANQLSQHRGCHDEIRLLRLAARDVCDFDWSDNDDDAVWAIKRLENLLPRPDRCRPLARTSSLRGMRHGNRTRHAGNGGTDVTVNPNIERIARLIARRLGHNDETGMHWERYVCAAELIDEEYQPRLKSRTPQAMEERG